MRMTDQERDGHTHDVSPRYPCEVMTIATVIHNDLNRRSSSSSRRIAMRGR
jgi:hypothetical protein